jgi:hypothetical protein
MNNVHLKEEIVNAAKEIGIDLIGFASKSRFASVDAAHNPFSIFPSICIIRLHNTV